tara:strand:+ start:132 stop:1277 length:1146 start_codon:yes stop_codon:yes gene_type:complete
MKITLKNTPEQVELVKAMASRNRDVAYEAQTALAEFIGPVLAEVVNNAPALSNLFTTLQYNADDNPSIPLDLYYDVSAEDYVQVFSQSRAGGLPTSEVLPTASELKIATYSLDSAVSFDRRYAAKSRMDVVAKTMTRVAQEILLKQNTISANVIMKAVANATTNSVAHVEEAAAVKRFVLADLNRMITRSKRIGASFVGGTPDSGIARGVTDIICSPEIVEELRAIAYNPINTKAAPAGGDGVRTSDVIAEEAYSAAGAPTFYGINVIELNEMGGSGLGSASRKFNDIFVAEQTGNVPLAGGAGGDQAAAGDDELVLGIDRSRESLVRPVAVDAESGGEFSLIADDQYSIRQNKIGYFGSLEEGRVVLDNRALVGTAVMGA